MSCLTVAPIIEQYAAHSRNVSDLNFSCGQKPQVEIREALFGVPIGLGRLFGISNGDDRHVDSPGQSGRRAPIGETTGRPILVMHYLESAVSCQYISAAHRFRS